MIKINLLAQRKAKRTDKGQQTLALGVLAVLAAVALVFLLVHRPLADEVDRLASGNRNIEKQNKGKKDRLKDFDKVKAEVESLLAKKEAIDVLNSARAVPADMLYELSSLLTPNREPRMTEKMSEQVGNDPHRKWSEQWDPKHLWVTSFGEKGAAFLLKGGAQSDGDVIQLAKRLEVSVFFDDVVPSTGVKREDKNSGITYYEFTISGRVVY
jgi:type IV pilus assembly protein PilN